MSDILAPEALGRIDTFFDHTLKPKLDAIDGRRREVRWLIIKASFVVLPPIGFLIGDDLLDPFVLHSAMSFARDDVWAVGQTQTESLAIHYADSCKGGRAGVPESR